MRFHLLIALLLFVNISFAGWLYQSVQQSSPEPQSAPAQPKMAQMVADSSPQPSAAITVAAARFEQYEHFIRGKKLALVVNHTAMVGQTHLVDTLLSRGHQIVRIFAPEHGFRGDADAGEKVDNTIDKKSRIPIVSVYGDKKKPRQADLEGVDLLIFDIQDVGVRFYTYTSTMSYMMDACAEYQIPLLVLDRPNPNGHIVDGFVLEPQYKSFVGLHPVPILHGLTVAEYAMMINGEGWLENQRRCQLYHVPCDGYRRGDYYQLPQAPSPNLANMRAVYLYPSLCFFEGTSVSVGRGTEKPFQQYGHPAFSGKNTQQFQPKPSYGSKNPLHNGKKCVGYDLSGLGIGQLQAQKGLDLAYLVGYYRDFPQKDSFFLKSNFFELLAGTDRLRKMLETGATEAEIRQSWQPELENYLKIRKKYLIYHD